MHSTCASIAARASAERHQTLHHDQQDQTLHDIVLIRNASQLSIRDLPLGRFTLSCANKTSKSYYPPVLTASFAMATTGAEKLAILRACSIARGTVSSTSNTLVTRPATAASCAVMFSPVNIMCIAYERLNQTNACVVNGHGTTDFPTARMRRCVPPAPGMVPSLISGCPKTAPFPA